MNLEEIVQNPLPGIQLHSLVTLGVLQLVFNSASFVIKLVIHLFTPSLGVFSHQADKNVNSESMQDI